MTIYFTETEKTNLKKLSTKTGRSVSNIVREAVKLILKMEVKHERLI